MTTFSHQTIVALAEIISELAAFTDPDKQVYQSRLNLPLFFKHHDLDYGWYWQKYSHFQESSALAIEELLIDFNKQQDSGDAIIKLIEDAVDPFYRFNDAEWSRGAAEHINAVVKSDGFELQRGSHGKYRLVPVGELLIAAELNAKVEQLGLESVARELKRLSEQVESDPEGALTAACSMVMSVCTTLLEGMGEPIPATRDIQHLSKELSRHLILLPEQHERKPEHIKADIKQILGGLVNVAGGIGKLRTHGGDAEGRGERALRIDSRIAKLAANAATSYSLFVLETWEKRLAGN